MGSDILGQFKNFKKRHMSHICSSNNKNDISYDYPFHRAIRKYGIENFEIIIIKENLTDCAMNMLENYYIEKFDLYAKNGKGYNTAKGGNGGSKFKGKTDEEMKEFGNKISKIQKGKEVSEETKRKMSESKKGENNHMYGKKLSKEDKIKKSKAIGASLIERWDKKGNLIDIKYQFEYKEMGFDAANIRRCCLGKQNHHKGFIFKYHKDIE